MKITCSYRRVLGFHQDGHCLAWKLGSAFETHPVSSSWLVTLQTLNHPAQKLLVLGCAILNAAIIHVSTLTITYPKLQEGWQRTEGIEDVGVVSPGPGDGGPQLSVAESTDEGEETAEYPHHQGHAHLKHNHVFLLFIYNVLLYNGLLQESLVAVFAKMMVIVFAN